MTVHSELHTSFPIMNITHITSDIVKVDRTFHKASYKDSYTPIFEPNWTLQNDSNGSVIEVDIPGVAKTNIDIEVNGRTVTVVGKRYIESGTKAIKITYDAVKDTSRGTQVNKDKENRAKNLLLQYHLRFCLGDDADGRKMACKSYRNGVLMITVPKRKQDPNYKITV